MSALSNFLANELLDHVLLGLAYSAPADVYVALFTSSTGLEAGDPAACDEVSGGGYGRVAATFSAGSDSASANTAEVAFSEASADWGEITHFAICDAATEGKILLWAELTNSRIVLTGDVARFKTGVLTVALQ
jgi:hypothetical protein